MEKAVNCGFISFSLLILIRKMHNSQAGVLIQPLVTFFFFTHVKISYVTNFNRVGVAQR